MTPSELIEGLKTNPPAAVYLFLGAEAYRRGICRARLIQQALPEEERESGLTRHDLEEISLIDVIDDARSLSLFTPRRVIWVTSAEAVVSRRKAEDANSPAAAALADYVKNPTPSVTLVFESSRYPMEGDGKKRLEAVRKYFSAIPARQVVEFAPYAPQDAQRLARELAKRVGLMVSNEELGLLAESVGYDAGRIATEIEKLRLYAGEGGAISAADIAKLTPSARTTTIFELVAALGGGDRKTALGLLDTLLQEGEYLPLALSFLETQFRHALVAKEMGLRNAKQVESYFNESGVRVWYRKAQEIYQTSTAFSAGELKNAVARIHWADVSLRDARPDDRTILESFVLGLKEVRE